MVRIMNWKEYSEEGLKERLMKEYALSEKGAEGMMKAAQDNPEKIIKGDLSGVIIQFASEIRIRWYLLE